MRRSGSTRGLTGRRGSGSVAIQAYDPDIALSGKLRADYDAARGITLMGVGQNVDAWADQSAVGNDLTATVGSTRPAYNETDADFNGRPSVEFDGNSEFLTRASFSMQDSGTLGSIWVLLVWSLETNVNGAAIWTYNNTLIRSSQVTAGRVSMLCLGTTSVGTSDWVAAGPNYTTYRYDGSNMSIALNGSVEDTDPETDTTATITSSFGLGANQAGSSPSHMKVARMFILNEIPTASEEAQLIAYVSSLYGVGP